MFAAVRDNQWYWGLGDPDGPAIAVTVLYFVVATACFAVYRKSRQVSKDEFCGAGLAQFWLILSILLAGLGVNKQADLQSLLTLYGRKILQRFHLYMYRREIQVAFIIGCTLLSGYCLTWALRGVRRWPSHSRVAAAGLGLQATFVIIRAASFHHIDHLLGVRLGNLKFNILLESSGLLMILLAAALALRTKPNVEPRGNAC